MRVEGKTDPEDDFPRNNGRSDRAPVCYALSTMNGPGATSVNDRVHTGSRIIHSHSYRKFALRTQPLTGSY